MEHKLPILILVSISIATFLISFKYSNTINYDKGFEFGLNEGEKHFKNTLNVLLKNNEEMFLNHYEFSENVVEFVEEITYSPDEFRINQIIDSINYNILKTFLYFSKVPNDRQIKIFSQYHEIKNDLIKDYYSQLEILNFFEDLDEKYFERKSRVLLKPITEVSLDRLWSILSEDIQSNLVNKILKASSSDEIEQELVQYAKEEFCLILSQNIIEVLNSSLLDYAKIYSFSGNIEKSSNRREKVSKLVSLEKKSTFTFDGERPIIGNWVKTKIIMEYRTFITIGVDLNKKFDVIIRKKAFNQNNKNQIIIKVNSPEIFKIHLQLIDVKNQTFFKEIWGNEVPKVHKYVQYLVAEKSKNEDMEEAKKSIEANFHNIYEPILNHTNEDYEVIVKYEY